MSVKVSIGLSVMQGFTTIADKSVSVEVDEINNPHEMLIAIELLMSAASEKKIFEVTSQSALDIFMDVMKSRIKKEATTKALAETAENQASTWKLQAQLTEAQMAEKQARCQLDGIIKIHNSDYVTAQDDDKLQKL